MSLFQTSIQSSTIPSTISKKIHGIEGPYCPSQPPFGSEWDESKVGVETFATREQWLTNYALEPSEFDESLGTIGAGNHFAELQKVVKVEDAAIFDSLGLSADKLVLLGES